VELLAILYAIQIIRRHSLSAMAHVPVQPPEPPPRNRTQPIRRGAAAFLHRLAKVVEPRVAAAG
jgi:hypothetical protein